ncbi:hypothetical protein N7489_010432 [Penicillium chrysogenum]|jgi:hypothetical protein|uniref:Lipase B n=1 Tax=Penicillium chrysogenum TaxID=5076 RepID=A0ABQ8WWE5_PENCH|nr:uncharacterized protein N7489_010432 [Penicillium chrysogenum]KAJ5229724.1 hypothetical protein N7489_010432 [Penicillium chrysogenum]KAJ5259128.1 hypothetical protein N7524_010684 [Penicillium chrysogenum]KAJ5282391.1 hypothetical protein N7505_000371 [Penicillium chrysogenum]
MRCHKVLRFVFFVSTSLGSPVPSYTSKGAQDVPDIFNKLFNTSTSHAPFSTDIYQELSQLQAKISDIATGKIKPVSSIEKGLSVLSSIPHDNNRTSLQNAIDIVSLGLVPSSITDILNGITNHEINSIANNNTKNPTPRIHPTRSFEDAPYDIPEERLRSAIYIPPAFSYGENNKIPVLLVPGTADPAGSTYYFSYAKLFTANPHTDPVWVNIPENSLGDIQSNAEYVAYAINYISALSQRPIGVLTWSQGSIDVQWALKYWPSTRAAVSDFMAVSGDFHGTLLATLCVFAKPFCSPAVQQQAYDTRFIRALRGGGGDSAFVPTTSVYSGDDFIVQPQSGDWASAALGDVHGVGVSNVQVQVACAGGAAGGSYSHSAMLVNPLAYALFVDALVHDGPGKLERIDLDAICGESLAPGLDVDDFLGIEAVSNVIGVLDVLLYGYNRNEEPPLRDYVHY